MDNTEVIDKTPFKSGNSKVVTITGIPNIPSKQELLFKPVEVNGVKCCLIVPHRRMGKYTLDDKPSNMTFQE